MTIRKQMSLLLGEQSIKSKAERKRQALIARQCDDAINLILDDTGPLFHLPPNIHRAIRGDMDSIVRTLEDEREKAERASEGGDDD